MNSDWYFSGRDGGDSRGLNDPLDEHFKNAQKESSVIRESIQNSIDAQLDDNLPVKVKFELFSMPTKDIPAIETLIIRSKQVRDKFSEKAKNGHKTAAKLISGLSLFEKPEINVLKISDFNTKGLQGEDGNESGSYHRLVESIGNSNYEGGRGGSFGYGKAACFVGSRTKTVFYSSLNEHGERIFTGKVRWPSFSCSQTGKEFQGIAQYGIIQNKATSIRDKGSIPPQFMRQETGTDIYVIGYQLNNNDYLEKFTIGIINNFWPAIYSNNLEVIYSDKLSQPFKSMTITSQSLNNYISQYRAQFKKNLTWEFYQTFTDPSHSFEEEVPGLGKVGLFIKFNSAFASKVFYMRRPKMKIQEKSKTYTSRSFSAVVNCSDEIGNEFLRRLEPPKHDRWSVNNLDDTGQRRRAREILKGLDSFIGNHFEKLDDEHYQNPSEIKGLSNWLPAEEDEQMLGSRPTLSSPTVKPEFIKIPTNRTTKAPKGEPKVNPREGHYGLNAEAKIASVVHKKLKLRAVFLNKGNRYLNYKVILYNQNKTDLGEIDLSLMVVGDDKKHPLRIKSVEAENGKAVKHEGNTIVKAGVGLKRKMQFSVKIYNSEPCVIGIEKIKTYGLTEVDKS